MKALDACKFEAQHPKQMRLSLWPSLAITIAIALLGVSCTSEAQESQQPPRQLPIASDPEEPLIEEPAYPSCAFANEAEMCEDFGTLKVKGPEYPSCYAASEGELCEQLGKNESQTSAVLCRLRRRA